MSFVTPKIDWAVDPVMAEDMNRIEENIRVLHQGNGHTPISVNVTSSSVDLSLSDGNLFSMSSTGTVTITRINGTGWTIGSVVYLMLNASVQLGWNSQLSASGNYLPVARFANAAIADSGTFGTGFDGCVAILMKHTNFWVLLNSYYDYS